MDLMVIRLFNHIVKKIYIYRQKETKIPLNNSSLCHWYSSFNTRGTVFQSFSYHSSISNINHHIIQ